MSKRKGVIFKVLGVTLGVRNFDFVSVVRQIALLTGKKTFGCISPKGNLVYVKGGEVPDMFLAALAGISIDVCYS
jgi:hypothetical protein